MDHSDPYKQGKAEYIAKLLKDDPKLALSQPVKYDGGLDGALGTVRLLQHRCGFPEKAYQVKFNGEINALRLSDYFTRQVCEPGEYFWMLGPVIMGGSLEEHEQLDPVLAWARGENVAPPAEVAVPVSIWTIVVAYRELLKEKGDGSPPVEYEEPHSHDEGRGD